MALPSRVVENLFWFGRYEERCDNAARLLRLALNQKLQIGEDEDDATGPVLALARNFGILQKEDDSERALLAGATKEDNPFGLPANLRYLERVAFNLRDRMSLDNWRTINNLIKDPVFGRIATLSDTLNWLDRNVTGLMTLSGFALDGMTRDDGWLFLSIGRRIERLGFCCLALHTAFESGLESGLNWLLRLADSIVTYRSRYLARPEWLPVLDLLVLDGTNPRSVMFQANAIMADLAKLEGIYGASGSGLFATSIAALNALVPETDLQPENDRLRDSLNALRNSGFTLSERLTQRFFNNSQAHVWATLGL